MNQENIADKIMKQFADTKCKINHSIENRWLKSFAEKLNPKESDLLVLAIDSLVKNEFILKKEFGLVLTEHGFNLIYPISEEEAIKKIGDIILNQFSKVNAKVNHVVDYHWINNILVPTLNPKEIDFLEKAITQLVNDGFIINKDTNLFNMFLTQKGFEKIY